MDWCLGSLMRGGERIVQGEPLGPSEPPADRLAFMIHSCLSTFGGMRHGGCFVLKDDEGGVAATALCFPPSATGSVRDDMEDNGTGGRWQPSAEQLEQLGPPPTGPLPAGAGRRFEMFLPLMEALEERALPHGTPHWYVLTFAVVRTHALLLLVIPEKPF